MTKALMHHNEYSKDLIPHVEQAPLVAVKDAYGDYSDIDRVGQEFVGGMGITLMSWHKGLGICKRRAYIGRNGSLHVLGHKEKIILTGVYIVDNCPGDDVVDQKELDWFFKVQADGTIAASSIQPQLKGKSKSYIAAYKPLPKKSQTSSPSTINSTPTPRTASLTSGPGDPMQYATSQNFPAHSRGFGSGVGAPYIQQPNMMMSSDLNTYVSQYGDPSFSSGPPYGGQNQMIATIPTDQYSPWPSQNNSSTQSSYVTSPTPYPYGEHPYGGQNQPLSMPVSPYTPSDTPGSNTQKYPDQTQFSQYGTIQSPTMPVYQEDLVFPEEEDYSEVDFTSNNEWLWDQ